MKTQLTYKISTYKEYDWEYIYGEGWTVLCENKGNHIVVWHSSYAGDRYDMLVETLMQHFKMPIKYVYIEDPELTETLTETGAIKISFTETIGDDCVGDSHFMDIRKEFITLTPLGYDNQELIKEYACNLGNMCDYTWAQLLMWADYNSIQYVEIGNMLYLIYTDGDKIEALLPLQKGGEVQEYAEHVQVIKALIGHTDITRIPIEALQKIVNTGLVEVNNAEINDDFSDYLYNYSDLSTFQGKKYQTQRNNVNKFIRNNPSARIVEVKLSDTRVIEFLSKYKETDSLDSSSDFKAVELAATDKFITNANPSYVITYILEVNNEVCGITVAEIYGETMFMHIEKCDINFDTSAGIYQYFTHTFLNKFNDAGIKFINREEDMGSEGLRRAKQSYRPIQLVRKYSVRV